MFKTKVKQLYYVLIVSLINVALYNIPLFKYVYEDDVLDAFNRFLLMISFIVTAIVLNFFIFNILLYLLRIVGKWIIALFFILNALSIYFINNYGVMIDISMIGNVFNTNYEEASSFFSFSLILYLFFLGILPTIILFKLQYTRSKIGAFLLQFFFPLLLLIAVVGANYFSPNVLWIDKNSKYVGSYVMPWSYVINSIRYYNKKQKENEKQTLLPDAKIANNDKSVVVLVIGESARSANFSLYGYNRNTNPLLSKVDGLHVYEAESAATYTTAGVKAILDYKETSDLNEILPNYLHRNGVNVVWRTTNWGEPKVNIENYKRKKELNELCKDSICDFDEILIHNLKDEIVNSNKNKTFVVLHSGTSHGPTYYKKYPKEFSKFSPVCKSVELSECTMDELVNAYDNTIVYTDYILASLIDALKELKDYKTTMLFVSDHGESLGENSTYMHGLPMAIAPKVQYEIPFLVWSSDDTIEFKNQNNASQYNVFHSVLDFLAIESPIYNEKMSLLKR